VIILDEGPLILPKLPETKVLIPLRNTAKEIVRCVKIECPMTYYAKRTWILFDPYTLMLRTKTLLAETFMSIDEQIPVLPWAFSFWLARNLTVEDKVRQELLECESVTLRLKMEIIILEQYNIIECASCHSTISTRKDIFSMSADGFLGAYVNPHGHVHETLTLLRARGLSVVGRPSTESSWFPGYAWTIAYCTGCRSHMGWKFESVDRNIKPAYFWGLSRRSLRTTKEKNENNGQAGPTGWPPMRWPTGNG